MVVKREDVKSEYGSVNRKKRERRKMEKGG